MTAASPLSLRGIYGSLHAPTLRDLVYSCKAFVAAVAALAVGFSLNLDNPYWSALTIYIVVNPPGAGAIRSKSLFRFLGTVAGGLAVLVLTGLFGDQIGILATATIGVVACAVFLQQIDKTPTNYVWFAFAITISVIVLNNISRPTSIFDVITARVGEISIGILAIAAVDSIWPEPMTPMFLKTMADWRSKARNWLVAAIGPDALLQDDGARDRLREIIKAVAVIDAKAIQLPFDVVWNAPRKRHLDLLRRQVVAVIGELIAIELRVGALRRAEIYSAGLQLRFEAVTAWVCDEPDWTDATLDAHVARGEAVIDELESAREGLDPADCRYALIERSLLARLAAFARDWCDLALALRSVDTGRKLPDRLNRATAGAKPVRSIDYLGGSLDLLPMVLAMSTATALWYFTAWDNGPTALLFAWAGCIFLLGQGQILQSMAGMLACVLAAFALVFLYQFVILPRVVDFTLLAIVLGAALIPLGVVMAMSMAGMLIVALMFSFLALQDAYRADFAQTVQTLSAVCVGILIAVVCLRLFDYDRPRFAARRLAAAVRRDVVDVARARRVPDGGRFLFLALYRLALYLAAADQVAKTGPVPRSGLITDLSIGANLLALRQQEARAAPAARAVIDGLRRTATGMVRGRAGLCDHGSLRAGVAAAMVDPAICSDPASGPLADALIGLDLALGPVRAEPAGETSR